MKFSFYGLKHTTPYVLTPHDNKKKYGNKNKKKYGNTNNIDQTIENFTTKYTTV